MAQSTDKLGLTQGIRIIRQIIIVTKTASRNNNGKGNIEFPLPFLAFCEILLCRT